MPLLDDVGAAIQSGGAAAAAFAALGTIAVALIKRSFHYREANLIEMRLVRADLDRELVALRANVETIRKESDDWQRKYYDLFAEFSKLGAQYETLKQQHDQLAEIVRALREQAELRELERGE